MANTYALDRAQAEAARLRAILERIQDAYSTMRRRHEEVSPGMCEVHQSSFNASVQALLTEALGE